MQGGKLTSCAIDFIVVLMIELYWYSTIVRAVLLYCGELYCSEMYCREIYCSEMYCREVYCIHSAGCSEIAQWCCTLYVL